MRPSACVTSTARSAAECFRTAATTSGSAIRKPLKKLTSETVTSRVFVLSNGMRSSVRSAPARLRHTRAVAGHEGWSHGVAPAGKSRSFTTTSSPSLSRSASAARLYASDEHEQMPISAGVRP